MVSGRQEEGDDQELAGEYLPKHKLVAETANFIDQQCSVVRFVVTELCRDIFPNDEEVGEVSHGVVEGGADDPARRKRERGGEGHR